MNAALHGRVAICMLGVMAALQASAAHEHGASRPASLPVGPDRARVEKYCTACHGIERVVNAGGTIAGWQDRIRRMQRWGARVPAESLQPLARYLAAALPPRPKPMMVHAESASTAVQEIRVQDIQRTLRYAARVTAPRELVLVDVPAADRVLLAAGQRVRLFAPQQRGGSITALVVRSGNAGTVALRTALDMPAGGTLMIAEVIVSLGRNLAVANDALVPDEAGFRVLVQDGAGGFAPRAIRLGHSGDQLTQVVTGLQAGEMVASLGTFFIDAEQRLESTR